MFRKTKSLYEVWNMKGVLVFAALVCGTLAAQVRLIDIDPNEAQQLINSHDQTLKYADKIKSDVPGVRFLENEPHDVQEDIYLAKQYYGQDGLGGYLYGYQIPHIAKNEKREPNGKLKGSYSYKTADGKEVKVEYWDDGDGFHQKDNALDITGQVDDAPDVAAEKEKFFKRWNQEAERNKNPLVDPNVKGTQDSGNQQGIPQSQSQNQPSGGSQYFGNPNSLQNQGDNPDYPGAASSTNQQSVPYKQGNQQPDVSQQNYGPNQSSSAPKSGNQYSESPAQGSQSYNPSQSGDSNPNHLYNQGDKSGYPGAAGSTNQQNVPYNQVQNQHSDPSQQNYGPNQSGNVANTAHQYPESPAKGSQSYKPSQSGDSNSNSFQGYKYDPPSATSSINQQNVPYNQGNQQPDVFEQNYGPNQSSRIANQANQYPDSLAQGPQSYTPSKSQGASSHQSGPANNYGSSDSEGAAGVGHPHPQSKVVPSYHPGQGPTQSSYEAQQPAASQHGSPSNPLQSGAEGQYQPVHNQGHSAQPAQEPQGMSSHQSGLANNYGSSYSQGVAGVGNPHPQSQVVPSYHSGQGPTQSSYKVEQPAASQHRSPSNSLQFGAGQQYQPVQHQGHSAQPAEGPQGTSSHQSGPANNYGSLDSQGAAGVGNPHPQSQVVPSYHPGQGPTQSSNEVQQPAVSQHGSPFNPLQIAAGGQYQPVQNQGHSAQPAQVPQSTSPQQSNPANNYGSSKPHGAAGVARHYLPSQSNVVPSHQPGQLKGIQIQGPTQSPNEAQKPGVSQQLAGQESQSSVGNLASPNAYGSPNLLHGSQPNPTQIGAEGQYQPVQNQGPTTHPAQGAQSYTPSQSQVTSPHQSGPANNYGSSDSQSAAEVGNIHPQSQVAPSYQPGQGQTQSTNEVQQRAVSQHGSPFNPSQTSAGGQYQPVQNQGPFAQSAQDSHVTSPHQSGPANNYGSSDSQGAAGVGNLHPQSQAVPSYHSGQGPTQSSYEAQQPAGSQHESQPNPSQIGAVGQYQPVQNQGHSAQPAPGPQGSSAYPSGPANNYGSSESQGAAGVGNIYPQSQVVPSYNPGQGPTESSYEAQHPAVSQHGSSSHPSQAGAAGQYQPLQNQGHSAQPAPGPQGTTSFSSAPANNYGSSELQGAAGVGNLHPQSQVVPSYQPGQAPTQSGAGQYQPEQNQGHSAQPAPGPQVTSSYQSGPVNNYGLFKPQGATGVARHYLPSPSQVVPSHQPGQIQIQGSAQSPNKGQQPIVSQQLAGQESQSVVGNSASPNVHGSQHLSHGSQPHPSQVGAGGQYQPVQNQGPSTHPAHGPQSYTPSQSQGTNSIQSGPANNYGPSESQDAAGVGNLHPQSQVVPSYQSGQGPAQSSYEAQQPAASQHGSPSHSSQTGAAGQYQPTQGAQSYAPSQSQGISSHQSGPANNYGSSEPQGVAEVGNLHPQSQVIPSYQPGQSPAQSSYEAQQPAASQHGSQTKPSQIGTGGQYQPAQNQGLSVQPAPRPQGTSLYPSGSTNNYGSSESQGVAEVENVHPQSQVIPSYQPGQGPAQSSYEAQQPAASQHGYQPNPSQIGAGGQYQPAQNQGQSAQPATRPQDTSSYPSGSTNNYGSSESVAGVGNIHHQSQVVPSYQPGQGPAQSSYEAQQPAASQHGSQPNPSQIGAGGQYQPVQNQGHSAQPFGSTNNYGSSESQGVAGVENIHPQSQVVPSYEAQQPAASQHGSAQPAQEPHVTSSHQSGSANNYGSSGSQGVAEVGNLYPQSQVAPSDQSDQGHTEAPYTAQPPAVQWAGEESQFRPNGQNQGPVAPDSENASEIDYNGEPSENKNYYAQSQPDGKSNNGENHEEHGPAKGFFYSIEYPVGIVVKNGERALPASGKS